MKEVKMKATKIVGAILGVLMVAALFAGAAAAHDNTVGDIYNYVLYPHLTLGEDQEMEFLGNTTWTNTVTGESISFVEDAVNKGMYYLPGTVKKGKYQRSLGENNYIINVMPLSAQVNGVIYENATSETPIGDLMDGTANTGNRIIINVPQTVGSQQGMVDVSGLAFTNPAGTFSGLNITQLEANKAKASTATNLIYNKTEGIDLGTWTVRAVFDKAHLGGVVASTAPDYIYGTEYKFTMTSADAAKTITAAKDEITQGGYVTMVVKAPYGDYQVKVDDEGIIPGGQPGVFNLSSGEILDKDGETAYVHVDSTGTAKFLVKSITSKNMKVTVFKDKTSGEEKKSVTIKIKPGAINATAEKDSVYIGDVVKLSGTNDLGGNLCIFLKGNNYLIWYPDFAAGSVWDLKIDTSKFKDPKFKDHPDAGTYTIFVAKLADSFINEKGGITAACNSITSTKDLDDHADGYTTVALNLVQPFITLQVPDVVVQGDKIKFTGQAEGNPTSINLYVFGTNFFGMSSAAVLDDGSYSRVITVMKGDDTSNATDNKWKMETGQYFAVAQHPMYDGVFNIIAEKVGEDKFEVKLNESVGFFNTNNPGNSGSTLFTINARQTANAAYALINAISSETIDDMQAHKSFIVAGATSYVNTIPSQVTKGQSMTVSGTTTGHENGMVSVELTSTAFAAVSKGTTGSASFYVRTSRIGADGVWSVTFDTSSMLADEYTVKITVGQEEIQTAKVNIVEGSAAVASTTTPNASTTTPKTPTTTPKTPGFGALAVLVGLGAVAVLLLRRQ